jgi:hypothetical protein
MIAGRKARSALWGEYANICIHVVRLDMGGDDVIWKGESRRVLAGESSKRGVLRCCRVQPTLEASCARPIRQEFTSLDEAGGSKWTRPKEPFQAQHNIIRDNTTSFSSPRTSHFINFILPSVFLFSSFILSQPKSFTQFRLQTTHHRHSAPPPCFVLPRRFLLILRLKGTILS